MLIHHGSEEAWADVNHVFGKEERLYIQCISFAYTAPYRGEARLDRERYFLHFVASGSGLYDDTPIGTGDIYIMEPGSVHRLKNTSDEPLTQFCIEFHGTDAAQLCREAGLSNLSRHRASDEAKVRRMLHEAVYEAGSMSEDALGKMALGVLYFFISQLTEEKEKNENGRSFDYVRRASVFMRENYMYGISASDASEAVGLTEKYLCRLFVRELGMTPTQYIADCRLKRAAELFSMPELSVSEIAQMTGFEDTAYFSRFISQRTGKSPSAHRRGGHKK